MVMCAEGLAEVRLLLNSRWQAKTHDHLFALPLNPRAFVANGVVPDLINSVDEVSCRQDLSIECTCAKRRCMLLSFLTTILTEHVYIPEPVHYTKIRQILMTYSDCAAETIRLVGVLTKDEVGLQRAIEAGIHCGLKSIASGTIHLQLVEDSLFLLTRIVQDCLTTRNDTISSEIARLDLFSAFAKAVCIWLTRQLFKTTDVDLSNNWVRPSNLMEFCILLPTVVPLKPFGHTINVWIGLLTAILRADEKLLYTATHKDEFYESLQLMIVYGEISSVKVVLSRLLFLLSESRMVVIKIVNANLIDRLLKRCSPDQLQHNSTAYLHEMFDLILKVIRILPDNRNVAIYKRNVISTLAKHNILHLVSSIIPGELFKLQRDGIAEELRRLQPGWC